MPLPGMELAMQDPTQACPLLFTDAAGLWGCGAYSDNRWFQCVWERRAHPLQIAIKEELSTQLVKRVSIMNNS